MLMNRLFRTTISVLLMIMIALSLTGGLSTARAEKLDPIEQFVERMYNIVLNRDSEEQGLNHWSEILRSRRMTGAQVAHAFFFCPEFKARGLGDRDFILTLYKTLMERVPAEWEIQHWLHHIWLGWPLDNVFSAFVHSAEFGLRCRDAGITQGTYIPPSGGMARVFATRLYRTALGREPDARGLDSWHNLLRTGSVTGASAAFSFLFSQELRSQNISNTEFIRRIYLTMMGREPDPEGREHFLRLLNANWPREDMFASFVASLEFEGICNELGFVRGTYTAPPGGMVRVFVTNVYNGALNRGPTDTELNEWQASLMRGSEAAVLAYELLFSNDNRSINDDEFVRRLSRAVLGRAATAAEVTNWSGQLRSGATTRYNLFVNFVNSAEFGRLCTDHGVTRGTAPQPINTVYGTGNMHKVWNMIVTADFRGISDRPEHVAGIVGNLMSEAGPSLCPFQIQVSNHAGLGLMQWTGRPGRRTDFENYMWSRGISEEAFYTEVRRHDTWYCNNPAMHPVELHDRVLQVQIDFMFHELRNTWERQYMGFIDFPTDRTGVAGARAYAELFCSLALRPGVGRTDNDAIRDLGVQTALMASPFVGGSGRLDRISYSGLAVRRDRAETAYLYFINNHR